MFLPNLKTTLLPIIAIAILSGTACTNKNAYTVTGMLPDSTANGKKVYISDYNTQNRVDSTTVNGNTFTFKGVISADSIRRIDVEGTRLYANFILEPGNINIEIEARKYKGSGTILNDQLNLLEAQAEQTFKKIDEKRQAIKKDSTIAPAKADSLIKVAFNSILDEHLRNLEGYVKQYPNTALSTFAIWQMLQASRDDKAIEKVKTLIATDTHAQNFTPINNIVKAANQKALTSAGKPFIDFSAKGGSITGEDISLSTFVGKGKYILVDFWASWCGPCMGEVPNLKNMYKKYKGDKFDIVSVAVWDKRENILNSIKTEDLMWNHIIMGDDKTATDLYGINGIPQIILFAPDGTIVARDLRGEKIDTTLKEALKK